jgi:hypothetical protein
MADFCATVGTLLNRAKANNRGRQEGGDFASFFFVRESLPQKCYESGTALPQKAMAASRGPLALRRFGKKVFNGAGDKSYVLTIFQQLPND